MNKLLKISLLLCLPIFLQAQLKLNNNGAIIKVNTGTDLRVNNGSIENKNVGSIDNNGNIYLDATFNQITGATYTAGATSWLWFEGTANQNATSDATMNIPRLRVDNGNRLILGNHVNVSTDVDLMFNGNIELGNFNLVVASGGTIANTDAANYIITNGTGYLQQEVSGANVFFPVGNSTYNPSWLSNIGVVDNLQLRVVDQVLAQGTTGAPLSSGVVNRTWMLSEEIVGGSDVSMQLFWTAANELAFDRLNSGVAHHLSGTLWDNPPSYTAAGAAGPYWTQSRGGFTSFSPFIVKDLSIDLPVEMLFFDAARLNADEVQLDWATASELNNKGFDIERMLANETEFTKVGYLDGQGTTLNTSNYQLMDDNSYTGTSYYRLKQIDFDGTIFYSEIRAVAGQTATNFGAVVFPNPVKDVLKVRFGALPAGVTSAGVKIMGINGQILQSFDINIQSHQLLEIKNMDRLVPASYVLSVTLDNGEQIMEKFIKTD